MKIISAAVALCSTLLLAACFPPTTSHPLGGPSNRGDSALLGRWDATMDESSDDKDNKAEFRFRQTSGGALRAELRSTNPKAKDDDRVVAIVSTAKLGPYRYLNARLIAMGKDNNDDEEKVEGTIPLLYRQNGKTVVLYMMDETATKKAINAHRIAGKVDPGSFGDAHITADQRTLDAFFSTPEGAGLFTDKFATLTRD